MFGCCCSCFQFRVRASSRSVCCGQLSLSKQKVIGKMSVRSEDSRKRTWRGMAVIFGGVLVHLSLGTLNTVGNMIPYLTSYMRWYKSQEDLTYTKSAWIFALGCMGQGLTMSFGGLIEHRLGPRLTTLIGGWCMSLGMALTYLTVKVSFVGTVLTYGLVFGIGVGIAYAVPLSCAMRWFPNHKGMASGIVVAGFGGGAFIFNQVQTAYINPDNHAPNQALNTTEKYFTEIGLLEKVPNTFLILGACYAVMQLIGSLLICDPPQEEVSEVYSTRYTVEGMEEEHKRAEIVHRTHQDNSAPLLKGAFQAGGKSDNQGADDKEEPSHSPLEMVRSRYFYFIWVMFLCNGQGSIFIASLYKAYGQTFIKDDMFLALVGAFAAVFSASGRIMWGIIADKISFKITILLMIASFLCLMLTLQITQLAGKPLFFIYICLIFLSFSGSYSLFPTATAKCFGRKHLTFNYGLVFTSQVITAPLQALLSSTLKDTIGWSGLFFVVAGFLVVSFIFALLFNAKDKNGKEI